ncbi:MAG: ATP-dependent DNA ligase [Methanocellales archaeon]|nr:ATP-dependent DNA ligase [Methanocellales archaeon]
MKFIEFAETCEKLEGITSNLEMTRIVSQLLQDTDELEIVTHFIMGRIFPAWSAEELGMGPSLLYDAIAMATGADKGRIKEVVRQRGDVGLACEELCSRRVQRPLFSGELTVEQVYRNFESIAQAGGKGSQKRKFRMLADLFGSAKPKEARYIARLVLEELRIGVGEGTVRDAIARAFDVSADLVERGYMLTNDLGLVAATAKEGAEGLEQLGIEPGKPIKMMLAQVAESMEGAIEEMEKAAIEWKYDGARMQIHKMDGEVQLYSRKLENVTKSLPDIVNLIKKDVTFKRAILDGEVIAIGEDGKPRPFQDILRRFRRKYDVEQMVKEIPFHLSLFDVLYDGQSLIDFPLSERRKILEKSLRAKHSSKIIVAPQIVTSDLTVADGIYQEALSAGHEGVMIKNPKSAYTPGKRGKNWLKIKPVMETLDLAVIGAEWGEGRRANLIGSYLLACRDVATGELLGIGRVGTGITDEQLAELTELFKALIVSEIGKEIDLKPEIVFEIAYEEIQKSPNYESGFALRFPRLISVRSDKSVGEADSMQRVRELYEKQKGRGTTREVREAP